MTRERGDEDERPEEEMIIGRMLLFSFNYITQDDTHDGLVWMY